MRSHIADQTMRMCQRLNDLTPQNGAVICFGHVMKLCVIFDNNSCSKIQFHKNRNDDKITTICKVTNFQCFAFMFDIYFCSYRGFLSVFPNMFVNKSKQIYLKKTSFSNPGHPIIVSKNGWDGTHHHLRKAALSLGSYRSHSQFRCIGSPGPPSKRGRPPETKGCS